MPLGTEVSLGTGHIVLDRDPASPQNGHSPQFSAHVYCGQMARWMKMPLGTEDHLGPGHIVRDGHSSPQFLAISTVAKQSHSQLLLSTCCK